MDRALGCLTDAYRILQAELDQTPEAAALRDLRRLTGRAIGAYDQHAKSMTRLKSHIQGQLEELPVFHLLHELERLIRWRAAMVGHNGTMLAVWVEHSESAEVDVWLNEGGALKWDD